jgi:hypothetical protein
MSTVHWIGSGSIRIEGNLTKCQNSVKTGIPTTHFGEEECILFGEGECILGRDTSTQLVAKRMNEMRNSSLVGPPSLTTAPALLASRLLLQTTNIPRTNVTTSTARQLNARHRQNRSHILRSASSKQIAHFAVGQFLPTIPSSETTVDCIHLARS